MVKSRGNHKHYHIPYCLLRSQKVKPQMGEGPWQTGDTSVQQLHWTDHVTLQCARPLSLERCYIPAVWPGPNALSDLHAVIMLAPVSQDCSGDWMRSCTASPWCGAECRVGTPKYELFFWPRLEGKTTGQEYSLPFSHRKVFPREDLGPKHERRKQRQTRCSGSQCSYKPKAKFEDSIGLFQKARDRWTEGWGSCPRKQRKTERRLSCSCWWLYYWKLASCSLRTLGRDTVPSPVPTWTGSDAAGSHGREASRRGWKRHP